MATRRISPEEEGISFGLSIVRTFDRQRALMEDREMRHAAKEHLAALEQEVTNAEDPLRSAQSALQDLQRRSAKGEDITPNQWQGAMADVMFSLSQSLTARQDAYARAITQSGGNEYVLRAVSPLIEANFKIGQDLGGHMDQLLKSISQSEGDEAADARLGRDIEARRDLEEFTQESLDERQSRLLEHEGGSGVISHKDELARRAYFRNQGIELGKGGQALVDYENTEYDKWYAQRTGTPMPSVEEPKEPVSELDQIDVRLSEIKTSKDALESKLKTVRQNIRDLREQKHGTPSGTGLTQIGTMGLGPEEQERLNLEERNAAILERLVVDLDAEHTKLTQNYGLKSSRRLGEELTQEIEARNLGVQ